MNFWGHLNYGGRSIAKNISKVEWFFVVVKKGHRAGGARMNIPLGVNIPHWGLSKKETMNLLKFNFWSNIIWNIFIYLRETEL